MICLTAFLCESCVPPPAIPSGDSPIEAHNPLHGQPTIQAWSKKNPVQLAVDTGATQAAIFFSPTVKNLGGRLRGKAPMQVTNLPISLTKEGPRLEEQTEVATVASAPYDGLLGWGTIQKFVWHLNIPKQHHDFYVSLPNQVKKWKKLPIVSNPHYLQLLNPNGELTLVDTGAPHTVYIARSKWESFKADYPDAFISIYSGYSPAAGGNYAYECMHIQSFRIGSLQLRNVIVCESFVDKKLMGIDRDIDVMLGLDAFKEHSFWIDPKGKALYFKKVAQIENHSPSYNLVGAAFIPSPDGNQPLTAKVATWSPAWHAGLRTGDILVGINGRLSPNDSLIEYVTTQEGARATVSFRRKGQIYTTKWVVPERPPAGEFHPTPLAVSAEEYQRLQQEEQVKQVEAQTLPPNIPTDNSSLTPPLPSPQGEPYQRHTPIPSNL